MSRESVYPTHKTTPEGRALTLERRATRANKYGPVVTNRAYGD